MVSDTYAEVKYSLKINLVSSSVNIIDTLGKNIFMEKDRNDNGIHHELQRDILESSTEMEKKRRWSNCRYESTTKGGNCSH